MNYFEVETRESQEGPTRVRSQRGDAVRAKLAELDLCEETISDAVAWVRGAKNEPNAHVNDE